MQERTSPGLSGIRVLEIGELVSAPYAAKLLADLGAEVIKIEPPDGERGRHRGPFAGPPDPDASGLYLALNTNKTSVIVDPEDPGESEAVLGPLLATADILITNLSSAVLAGYGVDLDELSATRPDLVITSITPFGLVGPLAHYHSEELTVAHGGGWAYQCPGTSQRWEEPPLKVFGHQTDYHAGVAAAMAALSAFDRAERTGVGELIDLSSIANTAGMLEAALIAASYMEENPNRLGTRLLNPWGIFRCSDGLVFIVTVEQDQWERLVALMGTPEWVETGLFDTVELRGENADLLAVYIEEWTEQFTVDEMWHRGQAERICFAPVLTMADMAGQDHLQQRGFLVDVDHPHAGTVTHLGAPFRSSTEMWGPLEPAPTLGEAAATSAIPGRPRFGPARHAQIRPAAHHDLATPDRATRPLEGLRVLDLSWVWAGPYAGLHLGFLGAEVVKIESSLRPGLGRRLALHPLDMEPSLNTSAYFNQWEQGKLSCELDLSQPEARQLVERLVAECDVVIENFATGVMDRLGFSYERLRELNPDIIVASISGYGSVGPLAEFMGYGPTTGPLSGLTSLTGYTDGPPEELGISFGDPAAGMMAAFAISAAVVARRATGEGCYLDVALWEATASNAIEGWMAQALGAEPIERMGNRDPIMAPHGCFRCAPEAGDPEPGPDDPGRWLSIACTDDEAWRALAGCIDPDLVDDARFTTAQDRQQNVDALESIVAEWTIRSNRWELTEQLQAAGVVAYPSMSPQDLLADEHLWKRGFFEQLNHPEVGPRIHAGAPWRLANSPDGVMSPAPLIGEHTDEVLSRLLGLSPEDVQGLRQRGASA